MAIEGSRPYWLVVEDQEADYLLLSIACTRSRSPKLHWVSSADSAKAFLDSCEVPPRLIVSDLNMPQMNGLELLQWVRAHPRLKDIPFVMLSSDASPRNISAAFEHGAKAFKLKPHNFSELAAVVVELGTLAQEQSGDGRL